MNNAIMLTVRETDVVLKLVEFCVAQGKGPDLPLVKYLVNLLRDSECVIIVT